MLLLFIVISFFPQTQSLGCANTVCLEGKCPAGYVCVDGTQTGAVSFCCDASLVTCDNMFGPCVAGACPGNSTCGYQNQCCPTSCPSSQIVGLCVNGYCSASSTCVGGYCCASSIQPQCQNSLGPCIGNKCAAGYVCDGSRCCCADSNDRCSDWAKEGFCNSTIFTAQDKLLCSKTCGLC